MPIVVICNCGEQLRAQDAWAGNVARCPVCRRIMTVPQVSAKPGADQRGHNTASFQSQRVDSYTRAIPTYPPAAAADPFASYEDSLPPVHNPGRFRRLFYVVLLISLLPLAWYTVQATQDDAKDRLEQTLKEHPEVEKQVHALPDNASYDKVLSLIPGDRIDGALLRRDTHLHWAFAAAAAIVFASCVLFGFPHRSASISRLIFAGVVSAIVGIAFLTAVQILAISAQRRYVIGASIYSILYWIAKAIGYSYQAALDPNSTFYASYLGFTFGVGLCEEISKALPLLVHYRHDTRGVLPWKGACMLGLTSGVGFGIAEGILYSANDYNGIAGMDAYLVRFVSCVALHAIWTGSAAISIFTQRHFLQGSRHWAEMFSSAMFMVAIPMILHGLYDTLLKKEQPKLALLAALASIGWLMLQIELARRAYDRPMRAPLSYALAPANQ